VIYVNGRPVPAADNPTIRELLLALDIDPDRAGIAVAVDAEVARRGAWPTQTLGDGARVEIVTATQGG
jgi:sulfur carrier protein